MNHTKNMKHMWEGCSSKKMRSLVWIMVALLWLGCHPSHPNQQTTEIAVDTVYIRGLKFIPDTLFISGPTRVVFVNQDIVVHNVTQLDSAWASPNLLAGDTWSKIFDRSANYFCTLHPTMKGFIRSQQ